MNRTTIFLLCGFYIVLAVLLISCSGGGSSGTGIESLQAATLSGRVVDPNGVPITGAEVTLSDTGESVVTDENGVYHFTQPLVSAGTIVQFQVESVMTAIVVDVPAGAEPEPLELNVVLDTEAGLFIVQGDEPVSSDDPPSEPLEPGDDIPPGVPCDPSAAAPCEEGFACLYDEEGCGQRNTSAHCLSLQPICPEIFAPVCGCDGRDYSSDCMALAAGVSILGPGACSEGRS